MSDSTFVRRSDTAGDSEAGRLLRQASELRGWSEAQQERLWQRLSDTVAPRRGAPLRWPLVLSWTTTALCIALAVSALTLAGRHGDRSSVDIAGEGSVELAPGAKVSWPSVAEASRPRTPRLTLVEGEALVRVLPHAAEQPFIVSTPHLTVVVTGTRFRVHAERDESWVLVEEGTVRVERRSGTVTLKSGERASSSEPRPEEPVIAASDLTSRPSHEEAPPASSPPPVDKATVVRSPKRAQSDTTEEGAAQGRGLQIVQQALAGFRIAQPADITGCDGAASSAERRACLQKLAAAPGLTGETALYMLAQLEERAGDRAAAVARWREHQRRFPEGVLAPEVALALFAELINMGHHEAAIATAESFCSRFATDPRAAEVALLRAHLLCAGPQATSLALSAYEHAAALARRSALRGEAIFGRGTCARGLGLLDEAQRAWEQYHGEFPRGEHAAEVERLLAH